jgi:hypothetical protein
MHSCIILAAAGAFDEILAATLNQPLPLTVYVQNREIAATERSPFNGVAEKLVVREPLRHSTVTW